MNLRWIFAGRLGGLRRRKIVFALLVMIIAMAYVFRAEEYSPSASRRQNPEPTVIVGAPQSRDDWPIDSSQLIRWATKDLPVAEGKQSDASVRVELVGEAGSQEVDEDDGELDEEFRQPDRILVLRLTPPSFPATLEAIRLLAPTIEGQSDRARDARLYFFADELSIGRPPSVSDFDRLTVTVQSTGDFRDFTIPGPTLMQRGDFYIGYEIRAPDGGFTFPIDTDSSQRLTFIAVSDTQEFQDFREVNGNLMVRAIVNVPETTTRLFEGPSTVNEFCWRVTPPERQATVRVSALTDGEVIASGDSEQFSISEELQSIDVTSPSGGEIWRMEEERLIQWDFERLVGGVRIELLGFVDDPGPGSEPDIRICLFDGEAIEPGTKLWEVSAPNPGIYAIRVSSSLDARFFDDSDFFVILNRVGAASSEGKLIDGLTRPGWRRARGEQRPALCASCTGLSRRLAQTGPSITVVTPNSGEVFEAGDRVDITWGSQGVPGRVRIVLFDLSTDPANPEEVLLFGGPVENTGRREWTVNARLSDAAKIGVISEQDASVADVSDGVFTIGSPGQGRITILMPGGQEIEAGTETRIVWMFEGIDIGNLLRLDVSFDGGVSYQLLDDEVDNVGDFRVGLNFDPGTRVRFRLVSKRNPFISAVTNCSIPLIEPKPPDPDEPKCPAPPR